jgi:HSP20 family molecular chaperone IbpA
MIRELGESIGDAVVESVGRAVGRTQEQRPLPTDLLESDDAYLVVFDAPGAVSSDVQVRFEDDTVSVRIDRFREFHEGYEMRFPGRGLALDGSITLPEDARVDASEATATLRDNGTLEVRIPKVGGESEEGSETEVGDDEPPADAADAAESAETGDEEASED